MAKLSFISYHYLARGDEFKKIWGHDFDLFKKHVDYCRQNYQFISAEDIINDKFEKNGNYVLLTFDDGLKEHYKIGKYLNEFGIKALFAIPTCILRGEPSNPQIIHFGMAYYGIRKFYQLVLAEIKTNFPAHLAKLPKAGAKTELMELHRIIKDFFRVDLNYSESRKALFNIYQKSLLKDFPDFMAMIYLNKKEIIELAHDGHIIAGHTDTHCVVRDIIDDRKIVEKELVESKNILHELIDKPINTFAYPFGLVDDILADPGILKNIGYDLIFSSYQTGSNLNKLNIGRYPSNSQDSVEDLKNKVWYYDY